MMPEGDEKLEELPAHVKAILDDEGLYAEAMSKLSDDELRKIVAPLIVT